MKTLECVQCGYCCTVGPCPFANWNPITHRCNYLTENDKCSQYDEIKKIPCPIFLLRSEQDALQQLGMLEDYAS
jgi:hypothetical protein